jgi:hypothetical protein
MRLRPAVAETLVASVTSAVKENVPATEVVPEMTPAEERFMPLGSWPLANVQM